MSLRARLIVAMAVVGIVLVFAAIAITRTTKTYLVGQLDDRLEETAGTSQRLPRGPRRSAAVRNPTSVRSARSSSPATTTMTCSPSTACRTRPVRRHRCPTSRSTACSRCEPGEREFFSVGSQGGPRYQVLAQRAGNSDAALVVATTREDVDDAISRLVRVELAATGAIVAILALVTFWVVRLGVRPIKRMTATASGIAAGDLSQRVPEGVSGTEAAELGTALNQMLGRIEDAFDERTRSEDRLRRFVGDASHELRTPVTTIRGYAELYRSGGLDDDDELREAMRRTEQEAIRMGALVDDLLLLARLDQGRPLERAPVDARRARRRRGA